MSSPTISRSVAAIRAGVFAELQQRIESRSASGGDLVPLHLGDTFVDPPALARYPSGALEGAEVDASLYRYGATIGMRELRLALAERARARCAIEGIDPDRELLVGCGATHAISCGARAILDPGDDVLLASPYWPLAHGIIAACGARPIEVPFTGRLYEDRTLDPAQLLRDALTERTRALYLITPNNPDGKVLTREQLERIASFACEHELWVIADEAYCDHAYDAPHVSIATLEGMRRRTITAHTLSKSHALAGARIGSIVAPEVVITAARKVSIHSVFNVSVACQRAALGALSEGDGWTERARSLYRAARDATVDALQGSGARFAIAEGGTYLFLDLRDVLDGRPLKVLLERAIDHGVLLAPGDAFGASYSSHARLCYTAVPTARVLEGVHRLRAAIDSLSRD